MTAKSKDPITCSQIATIPVLGQTSRIRHLAETDDQRLVVLETSYASKEPRVIQQPFTLEQALEHAENVLAGSARHITHQSTPLVLAGALLAMAAVLKKQHEPVEPAP